MPKPNLFQNDSEEEDEFKINEGYANRYDEWRTKEEYEKIKARGPISESDDSSSSEEEDGKTYGEGKNPDFDREFLLSLGTLYKHQREDVDLEKIQFFKGDYRVEKKEEEKPMTVRDFERHVITKHGGLYEEDINNTENNKPITKLPTKIIFEDGLDDDDSDEDGNDLLTSGLFKVKEDGNENPEEDDPKNTLIEYVKGTKTDLPNSKDQEVLDTLKGAWKDDTLSKKDKWLVNFFLSERYLAEDDEDAFDNDDAYLDEDELSEEEEEKESNPLATQYKFRHQEPGDIIKQHPRTATSTMRLKDDKRKKQRLTAKERKLQKTEEKRKDIEIIKAMKLKEIEDKIEKIKEASGNDDIDLGEVDLEGDFDPAAHDAYMERLIGDDYYDEANAEEELPEFEDIEDDTKLFDNWTQASTSKEEGGNENDYDEEHDNVGDDDGNDDWDDDGAYYDGNFNMDADYDPSNPPVEEAKKSIKGTRRKTRHKSKFSRVLEKKKPLFDPKDKKFSSYYDEYYKLDFEDVVGGIPCRFKYRNVECNDFGLTTGEILAAQNSDLNRWVGLRKIMCYNRTKELEDKERTQYRDRSKCEHVKQKILPSLYDGNPEELAEREREKRRLRNLKRKQKKWKLREGLEGDDENETPSKEGSNTNEENKPMIDAKEDMASSEKLTPDTGSGNETTEMVSSINKAHKHSDDMQNQANSKTGKKRKHKNDQSVDSQEGEIKLKQHQSDSAADQANPLTGKKRKQNRDQSDSLEEGIQMKSLKKDNETGNADIEASPKKKKKKKKKKKHSVNTDVEDGAKESSQIGKATVGQDKVKPSKKKRSKEQIKQMKEHIKNRKGSVYFRGISDERLEAYGQNPKKLKNRVVYGKDL